MHESPSLVPSRHEIETAIKTFSKKQWLAFFASVFVLVVSTLILVANLNQRILVGIPAHGGAETEGIVGTPRFINPILALSDADKDLTALVYSGLMRKMPDGEIIPDLASKYEVSADGLTYTFTLKDNIYFQDGTKVTSDDVAYTINQAEDPLIKSPKEVNWDGVEVTVPNPQTVVFTLKQRFASFLDNTTLGILPAHLWHDLSPEQFGLSNLNIRPIGSGPFVVSKVNQTSSGIPSSYDLKPFSRFIFGKPYLDRITLVFYANEKDLISALENGSVNAINSISTDQAKLLSKNGYTVKTTTLPRVFGLYFNQSENKLFTDKNVVTALELAISKKNIVDTVLNTYGTPISSPVPPLLLSGDASSNPTIADNQDLDKAAAILTKDGWKKNADGIWEKTDGKGKKATTTQLSFSISTSDTDELKQTAQAIQTDLQNFGVHVDLKIFEIGALNQTVIRPRKFEALFFGQVINHDTDLFAFWDSSQRNDPGLNIAMYANAHADKDLETASGTLDQAKRTSLYEAFETEVGNDKPAIFIYSPAFISVSRNAAKGLDLERMTSASDRFENVWQWYTEEERVWSIFVPKN